MPEMGTQSDVNENTFVNIFGTHCNCANQGLLNTLVAHVDPMRACTSWNTAAMYKFSLVA
jgi:hypothetical protein